MHHPIEILPLNAIDFNQWLILWQAYQQFYQAQIAQDVTANTWRKLIDPAHSHMYGFAAVQNGQAVGLVHVIEHDSCWTIKPYAYLQDLYTHEASRGQGVARKLIQRVHDDAMARQCDRVYWLTHQSNVTAQQLYDRIAKKTGFIQYRM